MDTNTEVNLPRKDFLNNLLRLIQATIRCHRAHHRPRAYKDLLRVYKGLPKEFLKGLLKVFHRGFHKGFHKEFHNFPKVIPRAFLPKVPKLTRITKFPLNRYLLNSMAIVSTASTSHNRFEILIHHRK